MAGDDYSHPDSHQKAGTAFAGVGKDAPFHRLHLAVIYRVTIGTLKNCSVAVYTYFSPFRTAGHRLRGVRRLRVISIPNCTIVSSAASGNLWRLAISHQIDGGITVGSTDVVRFLRHQRDHGKYQSNTERCHKGMFSHFFHADYNRVPPRAYSVACRKVFRRFIRNLCGGGIRKRPNP